MDSVAFATWLADIQRPDASQRRRAFRGLALAEADISGVFFHASPLRRRYPLRLKPRRAAALSRRRANRAFRHESVKAGSPVLAARIAVATRFVPGDRPVASPATAA